jgi:hypothetical protein
MASVPNPQSNQASSSKPDIDHKFYSLTGADFALDTATPLALRSPECTLVLFYNDLNKEDRDLLQVWSEVSRRGIIAKFAAINVRIETGVAQGISYTINNLDNPLYKFAPKGLPVIIVYRKSYPQAFYNGPRNVASILDYAMTLACQSSYHEEQQLRYGVDVDKAQTVGIGGTISPTTIPLSSTEFTSTLRGYTPPSVPHSNAVSPANQPVGPSPQPMTVPAQPTNVPMPKKKKRLFS